ncbi:MAG: serine/threonine-protein kinase [Polyangiaceae bacterium]
MAAEAPVDPVRVVGRYALYDPIAAGGMATVHFGRLRGPVGFARTVAIKRLHPELARDPEFVSMFLDEARLAARIRHPNVVQTLDVVAEDGELFLVMEYVQGESLARLLRTLSMRGERIPHRMVATILSGALLGLHAAHEAKDEQGARLGLVHRDVSPHNVLVGADGLTRVLDFGVAKAAGRVHTTREGRVKGKLAYMAPEQIQSGEVTREADIYSASVVLWEALTGTRLFHADNQTTVLARILAGNVNPPSQIVPDLPKGYDEVIARGLARVPSDRFSSAREMALALEAVDGVESPTKVAEWLEGRAGNVLEARAERIASIERGSDVSNVSELQAALTAMDRGSQSQSGVISVAPQQPVRNRRLLLAGLAAAALVTVVGLGLAVRALRAPAVEVEAVPGPAVAADVPGHPDVAPVMTLEKTPSDDPEVAAAASVAPTAEATKPAEPSARPKVTQPNAKRSTPSTTAAKSGKKNPFEGLGGRL